MRKKLLTKNIGILVSNETFSQLVKETDRREITISEYIRQLIEERLNREEWEKTDE